MADITPIAQVSTDQASGNINYTHGLTLLTDDVLVITVNANNGANTVTDNNGSTPCTEDHHRSNPDSGVFYVFHRVCGSSEPSAYAFTLGISDRSSIIIQQFRGVDATVWDVAPGAGSSDTGSGDANSEAPAITILTSGACGLVLMGDDFTPTTTTFSSIDNGYGTVKSQSGQQYQVTAIKTGLSTGSTGITTITSSSTVAWVAYQVALKPSPATVEQEGFAFGLDDGNEASHTLETQDTNISTADNLTRLIRALLNTTGDFASTAFKLKFQKNGSGGYSTMRIGANYKVTPIIEAADTTSSGDNNTTPTSPWPVSRPTAATGDLLVLIIGWDDSVTNTGVTVANGPNGEVWTQINSVVASASTEVRMTAYYVVATGAWGAGSISVTPNANEQWTATVIKVLSGEFDAATPIGASNTRASAGTAETNALSPSLTAGASDGGGRLIWAVTTDTDPLVTLQSGNTSIANNDRGNEALGVAIRDTEVSNSESIAGGATWSLAGDSWCSITFVIRAPTVNNDIYITTSANIAAGGENTTARLSAPSGKTTSDFATGRRWDDENGTDLIDIPTDDYSEFEWCVALKSGLANGDYFDMRVYAGDVALSPYTVTPRWTVATGGAVGPLLDGHLVKHGILQGRLVRS